MATKEEMTLDFAKVLNCQPKFVNTRLVALGQYEHCSRCGGGGHYSYCQTYGTTCFKCGGSGKFALKLTAKLLNQVTQQVANGEMQPYLDAMAARAYAKKAYKSLMKVWGDLPSVAAEKGIHFTKCSERHHDVNAFCHYVIKKADQLIDEIQYGIRESSPHTGATTKMVKMTDEQVVTHKKRIEKLADLMTKAEELTKPRPEYNEVTGTYIDQQSWNQYMASLVD